MSQERNKKAVGVAIALGFELLSLVFLGYYLGGLKGLAEIGAVAGSVLGFALWTWRLIHTKKYLL